MEEKKLYRVTTPVAWGGRRERGEIMELTAEEAIQIGLVELVVPEPEVAVEAVTAPEEEKVLTDADTKSGDYAPVSSPEEQVAGAEAETPTEEVKAPEEVATEPSDVKTEGEAKENEK